LTFSNNTNKLDARDMTGCESRRRSFTGYHDTRIDKITEKKTLRCVAGCRMERNIESPRAAEIMPDPIPQFVPMGWRT
jgi:hypothetical protein